MSTGESSSRLGHTEIKVGTFQMPSDYSLKGKRKIISSYFDHELSSSLLGNGILVNMHRSISRAYTYMYFPLHFVTNEVSETGLPSPKDIRIYSDGHNRNSYSHCADSTERSRLLLEDNSSVSDTSFRNKIKATDVIHKDRGT
jgi:hypothetical protein